MELGHTLEVWNCDYRKDAYADAWGQLQWGWVVLGRERIEVIGTMEGVEPYTNRHDPDYKTLARDSADRTYVSEPVIDYCGTRTWVRDDETYWRAKPYSTAGYVTPEGEPIVEAS
jgi:hypothetical protein